MLFETNGSSLLASTEKVATKETVGANKLTVTALLKNGRALRLVPMGCAHSGAEAALWFDSKVPASDVNAWLKEAIALTRIALVN